MTFGPYDLKDGDFTPAGRPSVEYLADVVATRAELDTRIRELVAQARVEGSSWELIGRALGTTKQSAWDTYGKGKK